MSQRDDDRSSASAAVVDFDALRVALGDAPRQARPSTPNVADSHGQASATYASARPHSIPPTRAPADERNAPAVIVKPEDTLPMASPLPPPTVPPVRAAPFAGGHHSSGPRPVAHPPSSPAAPSTSIAQRFPPSAPPMPAAQPHTPMPYAAQPEHRPGQQTVVMPGRPRRPRTETVVVRLRGPTKAQKIMVFVAVLTGFVAGGLAFLLYGKAVGWYVAAPRPQPAIPTVAQTSAAVPAPAIAVTSAAASAVAAPSAAAAAVTSAAVSTPAAPASSIPAVAPTSTSKKKR